MKIELSKYEKALEYEIFVEKEYEIIERFLHDDAMVFDIWWHIWLFSLYCLKINSNLNIHYFEPVVEYCEKAKAILTDYQVIFNNVGVWKECSSCTFHINQHKSMQSSIYNSFLNQEKSSCEVTCISIDDYFSKNWIKKIDLMKLDIEWAEFEVLQNMQSFDKIDVLVFEYHLIANFELKSLIKKLSKVYKNIQVFPSKYTEKIWKVLCTNK